MDNLYIFFFFILGLLLGSFANVVILRLPKKESVVTPRSHCPKCNKNLLWYHNIPVFSWLFLKGKCAFCKAPISFRYPLVELMMGVAFALVYWKVGFSWLLLEYLIFTFGLITVSFIDLDHMILPDVFTLSGIVIGLVGALLNPEREFMPAFAGFLMGGGFLWAVAYVYLAIRGVEGMGGGDIKLLAWIGAVLTWYSIPFVILGASLVGSFVGIIMAIRHKQGLKSSLPFGPYLAAAAFLYILAGQELSFWYLRLFMPSLFPAN